MDHMSLSAHFCTNSQQKETTDITQLDDIRPSAPDDSIPYPTNVNFPPTFLSIDNLISTPIAKNPLFKSNHFKMKEVEIHLAKNTFDIMETRMNSFKNLSTLSCAKAYPKKKCRHKRDDKIYKVVFGAFINRKDNIHVTKISVIERAHNCEMFGPVLEKLYQEFSEEVVDKKIVNLYFNTVLD